MTFAKGGADINDRPAILKRASSSNASQTFLAIIGGSCVAGGFLNILHAHHHHSLDDIHLHNAQQNQQQHLKQHQQYEHEDFLGSAVHQAMHDFMKGTVPKKKTRAAADVEKNHHATINNEQAAEEYPERVAAYRQHDVEYYEEKGPTRSSLSCEKYGGPADEFAQEMVYWQDIRSDALFVSPFHPTSSVHEHGDDTGTAKRLYMTFEPDEGGWNNIRMALETVLGLAIAMGRTLVLPPAQRMYLLGKTGKDKRQKTHFGFSDFFPMHELASENKGVEIITMKEFLELEAMIGHLRNKQTGLVEFPPNNRTDWDGGSGKERTLLHEWLRTVTHTPIWGPGSCMAAFPASGNHNDVEQLNAMLQQIRKDGTTVDTFIDSPTPVNASPVERMRENLAHRTDLCVYNEQMQKEHVVHFMCDHKQHVRLLVHFYVFLFFEDWRQDVWIKRFMRDHVRYVDEIQCAAARIVHAMRQHVQRRTGAAAGEFHTFHVRRGDFQFKRTRIDASEIYTNVKGILTENSTVFIATDERDSSFFDPLREHFDVKLLSDFDDLLAGVNTNYDGMIDQLVASRGEMFFGCWHSTFTGFIMRMRGYHSAKDKLAGYENGTLPLSSYYVPIGMRDVMHKYAPVKPAFFNREFPTSWRDIDQGIGNHPGIEESVL